MMTQTDPLSDALTHIKNSENAAKQVIVIQPASKLLGEILRVIQEKGYVGKYEKTQEKNHAAYKVELLGKINRISVIKPRYAVGKNDFERFEKRFLPARDIGTIIVSTSQGVMAHEQSKEKAIGGRLIAYVY